jgi:hypothetical protein
MGQTLYSHDEVETYLKIVEYLSEIDGTEGRSETLDKEIKRVFRGLTGEIVSVLAHDITAGGYAPNLSGPEIARLMLNRLNPHNITKDLSDRVRKVRVKVNQRLENVSE